MRTQPTTPSPTLQRGMTLVELMVAMTISLMMLAGLVSLFVNTSRTNAEMAKTNYLIEDGRVAIQVLSDDLMHAGFWGGYVPQFDDLTHVGIPSDTPTATPNPCAEYTTWDAAHELNMLGIAVDVRDALPAGAGCIAPLTKLANSDVLVVRHLETCVPGVGNCEADAAGRLYFQFPQCEQEKNHTAQSGTYNSITLDPNALGVANAYVGATIHTTGGSGGGQFRKVIGYDAARVATVDSNWTATPDSTTTYALQYVLGTSSYQLNRLDCATIAEKRRFISHVYYLANLTQNGITVPTLVRSQLDLQSGFIAQHPPVPLVDGVEAFRVVVGIDDRGKTGTAVDYTTEVTWQNPNNKVTATNRGDGVPDRFVRCTAGAPCTFADLRDVVAVKLFVLTRSRETTPGHTDRKSYCVSEPQSDGSCAVADTLGPFNDNYKRQMFTTSVRLVNVSGRRDTP